MAVVCCKYKYNIICKRAHFQPKLLQLLVDVLVQFHIQVGRGRVWCNEVVTMDQKKLNVVYGAPICAVMSTIC